MNKRDLNIDNLMTLLANEYGSRKALNDALIELLKLYATDYDSFLCCFNDNELNAILN